MHIDILAAADCPHCVRLQRQVERRFASVTCCHVDTHAHPEALRRFGLEVSPVVVLDGRVFAGDDAILQLLRESGARST